MYIFHAMNSWWRHQMKTFSALLAICAGNSPVPGEFPAQRPVTRSFDVFFDQRLNKRLSKQSWDWWLETLSRPLWRHRNVYCNGKSNKIANVITPHHEKAFCVTMRVYPTIYEHIFVLMCVVILGIICGLISSQYFCSLFTTKSWSYDCFR